MSLRRLFLKLNEWIFQNMNKLYLWIMIFLTLSTGIGLYGVNHSTNLITVLSLNIFLLYGTYKIIFR
jgi:hypothetical protein